MHICCAFVKIDVSKAMLNVTTEIPSVVNTTPLSSSTAATTLKVTSAASSSTTQSTTTSMAQTTVKPKQSSDPKKNETISESGVNKTVSLDDWQTLRGANKRLHAPSNYYCACDLIVSSLLLFFFYLNVQLVTIMNQPLINFRNLNLNYLM